MSRIALAVGLIPSLLSATNAQADGRYYDRIYPPSQQSGELTIGVTHTVWVPDGVERLRGVIVHQHGCGAGACTGGETSAYDLHWQALARKWDCVLLGPSYHQQQGQNCRLWCDPRNGSDAVFLRALEELADKSGHPELKDVPWCLWGHSGGAFWASLMQTLHPERVIAAWLRSGNAWTAWNKGEIDAPVLTEAVYAIPTMLNPGIKERDHERFNVAWTGSMSLFHEYRAAGALIGFAPDPRTAHECGDSRYLAIPFFDICLAARLPEAGSQDRTLRQMDSSASWLAESFEASPVPAAEFQGDPATAIWLPDSGFAAKWAEYVRTGAVSDDTPPPSPINVVVRERDPDRTVITWDADADFESGLRQFIVLLDGREVGRVPAEPQSRFGRPLFQGMSYHDTPNAPLSRMEFELDEPVTGDAHAWTVISVNGVGLTSSAVGTTPDE